jgi:hypothetical protein
MRYLLVLPFVHPKRRKIWLIEGNAKCCHLKKLTCKGTLRQVFICLRPRTLYPPSHTVYLYLYTRGERQQFTKLGQKYQHVLLGSERMGPLSLTPTLWMFPLACTKSWLPAFYPPTSRHTTQVLHNMSVVVWNLYCDRNSHQKVSSKRNLRRFQQIINHDIYTMICNKSKIIGDNKILGSTNIGDNIILASTKYKHLLLVEMLNKGYSLPASLYGRTTSCTVPTWLYWLYMPKSHKICAPTRI